MKNLLIVDDSYTVRKVIEMLLVPLGYNLSFAENSAEALEAVNSMNFDAVVLDHGLPDAKSVDVSAKIKDEFPGMPLLLMFSGKEELPESVIKDSHCDDTVEKPFDSQTFLSKIDALKDKSSKIANEPFHEKPAPVEAPALKEDSFFDFDLSKEFSDDAPKLESTVVGKPVSVEKPTEKEDPFFDFDLGEEFSDDKGKPEKTAVSEPAGKPQEKEDLLEIEDFEEIEELDEMEDMNVPGNAFQETSQTKIDLPEKENLVEEISLEELLEEDELKIEDINEPEPARGSAPEISFEELEEEKEEKPEVKKFTEVPNVSIEDFFADLNDILSEKETKPEVKKEARETVKVKPVVAEVAKDLREFDAVGKKQKDIDEDVDVWAFDTEPEELKSAQPPAGSPTPAQFADAMKSFDRKELENMIREITYEVVEKISWEVVPEIVDTIMKDKLGKK